MGLHPENFCAAAVSISMLRLSTGGVDLHLCIVDRLGSQNSLTAELPSRGRSDRLPTRCTSVTYLLKGSAIALSNMQKSNKHGAPNLTRGKRFLQTCLWSVPS